MNKVLKLLALLIVVGSVVGVACGGGDSTEAPRLSTATADPSVATEPAGTPTAARPTATATVPSAAPVPREILAIFDALRSVPSLTPDELSATQAWFTDQWQRAITPFKQFDALGGLYSSLKAADKNATDPALKAQMDALRDYIASRPEWAEYYNMVKDDLFLP